MSNTDNFTAQDLMSLRVTTRAQRPFLEAIPLAWRRSDPLRWASRRRTLKTGEAQ
jgi:hypothetical protein